MLYTRHRWSGRFQTRLAQGVRLTLCLALLLGYFPSRAFAAAVAAPHEAVPQAPFACPASPSGLPNVIERAEFCVYYDDDDTTAAQATTVADHTQTYWDRYTDDFGFREPLFTSKLVVEILDSTSCNGGTGPSVNDFNLFTGCFSLAESVQQTVGHELFHRVQYSYHGTEVKWFKEGTARAMEDLAFANIDNWPNALMAAFSFNLQANEYLGNTNVDITTIPQRYNSALWWKYFAEQFGSTVTEPQRGVDAMLTLWEAAETLDDVAALNAALTNLGAGTNFDTAFRRFAAANWIKDLTNQPGPWANYLDEDEPGNPGGYGPIVPTNGGTVSTGTPATFANQFLSRYGARYYRATPSASNCPVVSVDFHTDSGPAFYHVMTQKGGALDSYAGSTAADYTRAFFNDGLTSIVAIAGSTNSTAQADVTLECVNPVVDIKLPNSGAVASVGPFDGPGKLLAQVLVTNGDPAGPVVAGLTVNDFKAKVNGQNAAVTAGGFIQEQYWLVIQAPTQAADGVYDLEVSLEKSGTTTVIATDTNPASVAYNSNNIDHLLVVDRSGSMSSDNKMTAAKAAANFYVDITRNNDGLAVVPYNQDVNPAPFPLTEVTTAPNVRQNAKNYISALTPGGLTSIGDGLAEAVNQRSGSTTGNTACSFVLLSDGMENSPQFWADVQAGVVATGCPVTSIAFGGASDEVKMQAIATATGGTYFYNDVFVSPGMSAASVEATDAAADTVLDLGNTYEYAQAQGEGRQRLAKRQGVITQKPVGASLVQTHTVPVDDSVTEALFALDWIPGLPLSMTLRSPSGSLITQEERPYDFVDYPSGHLGWRISNPEPGVWEVIVDYQQFSGPDLQAAGVDGGSAVINPNTPYQVLVSGQSPLTAHLLLPARYGRTFFTGNRVPIYALISGQGPLGGLHPLAIVTAPDGTKTQVPLVDIGGGVYQGFYTKVNQANTVPPAGEDPENPPPPKDEGSYRVLLQVQGADFQREALGAFSVEEGADADNDDLPDPYEEENSLDIDSQDLDLDDLDALSEYQVGTDPNNSDTDGGGENDGSEYTKGQDPFDPSDDQIVAPGFLTAEPNVGFNVIGYDVQPEYNLMRLYRSTSPNGPWELRSGELPHTGIYTDTADNGTTYHYRYLGIDSDDHRSAVIGTSPATPSADPFPPEARMLIDKGALTTQDLDVLLDFVPYGHDEEELERFDDIQEMKIGNSPDLSGAEWRPFDATDVPWQLPPTDPGALAKVYAQFKDDAGNESLVTVAGIVVEEPSGGESGNIFLPFIEK